LSVLFELLHVFGRPQDGNRVPVDVHRVVSEDIAMMIVAVVAIRGGIRSA
jgi:hypothetical protein